MLYELKKIYVDFPLRICYYNSIESVTSHAHTLRYGITSKFYR
nr:MAG TPA: hypothetical protein [Caudoviricetes sp.]